MRKFVLALFLASILLPAAASGVRAANVGCMDTNGNSRHNGNSIYSQLANPWAYRWVQGQIDPNYAGFEPCEGSGGPFAADGPSAWVSLVEHRDEPGSDASRIIQIGIVNCNDLLYTACNGDNQFHYFWAWGGCDFNIPWPRDLGVANGNPHVYQIDYSVIEQTYYFRIDTYVKATLPRSAISCWDDEMEVQVSAEWWDGGDSHGNATDKLNFIDLRFRSESDSYTTWRTPCRNCSLSNATDWTTNTACSFSDDSPQPNGIDGKCDIINNDSFDTWSVPW